MRPAYYWVDTSLHIVFFALGMLGTHNMLLLQLTAHPYATPQTPPHLNVPQLLNQVVIATHQVSRCCN